MKKLKEIGQILTRQEMKFVSGGGFPPCDDTSVCGPGCAVTTDPHPIIQVGYHCASDEGGGHKTCRPYQCGGTVS